MSTIQKILDTIKSDTKSTNKNINHDEFIETSVNLFKEEFLQVRQSILNEKRSISDMFTKQSLKYLEEELNTLESLVILCTEVGENFNQKYRTKAREEQNLVFHMIVNHHARACHIAQDMLVLLKSGYADAAYARWRTLHEVNATAQFIHKHGQECAERFFYYSAIEIYRSATQYKNYEDRLNGEGPRNEDILELTKRFDELIVKYGKSFGKPYGWACLFIHDEEKCKNKTNISFSDIEKDVNLDYLRPHYKWASQNTHASPEGLKPTLGLSEAVENIFLVGQSNSGIALPIHSLAISLVHTTSIFLLMEQTDDLYITMKFLLSLKNDIGDMLTNKNK